MALDEYFPTLIADLFLLFPQFSPGVSGG